MAAGGGSAHARRHADRLQGGRCRCVHADHGRHRRAGKEGLLLSPAAASSFADALRQAVQMFRAGRSSVDEGEISQEWNPATDRIVIATDAGAQRAVREHLAKVVARWATAPLAAGEDQLATNDLERKARLIFVGHLRRLWEQETGGAITPEQIRAFCSVVRIVGLDLQPAGRDLATVWAILNSVLLDRTQVDNAWNLLLVVCQELAVDRRFATSEELRGILTASPRPTRSASMNP